MKISKTGLTLFDELFAGKVFPDDFSRWMDWNIEVNKWLEFVSNFDPEYFSRVRTRVNRKDERDGVLTELKVIYYLGKIKGIEIESLEPNQGLTDIAFFESDKTLWHGEIKLSTWQSDVFEDKNLTKAEKLERVKMPRFLPKGGSFDFDEVFRSIVFNPIRKSKHKFSYGNNNILFIEHTKNKPVFFNPIASFDPVYVIQDIFDELEIEGLIQKVLILDNINSGESGIDYKEYLYNF